MSPMCSDRRDHSGQLGCRLGAMLILGLSMVIDGCAHMEAYFSFWGRQRDLGRAFQQEPCVEVLRELSPEHCLLLTGRIQSGQDYGGPVLFWAVSDRFKRREIAASRILQVPVEYYQAYLPEGQYDLFFFADLNQDGFFGTNELVQSDFISVNREISNAGAGLVVNGPAVRLNLDAPMQSAIPVNVPVRQSDFVRDSLDDEFFDPKYGMTGLYDPTAMVTHTQRFLFATERFDPSKTIVLFVHGVGGTPRDFKFLAEGLDRDRFQAWFYYYPSGMPLGNLSSLLAAILAGAEETPALRHTRIMVVAHSMGGLVALAALNQLCERGQPSRVKGYISFDTPYGGVDSAKAGVNRSPAVVPSWRDVMPGSPFLEQLYSGRAGRVLPFCMFFGYQTGQSSDGTITLQSQLDPRIHLMASRSYGFNLSHVGILNDSSVVTAFRQVLVDVMGQ